MLSTLISTTSTSTSTTTTSTSVASSITSTITGIPINFGAAALVAIVCLVGLLILKENLHLFKTNAGAKQLVIVPIIALSAIFILTAVYQISMALG